MPHELQCMSYTVWSQNGMSVEVIYIIIVTYLLSEAIFIQIGKTRSKDPFDPQVYELCLPLILFIVVLRSGQNIFEFLSQISLWNAEKSLPLSKIMKKQLFCVMNPFDEMCNQKDIDCLTMAFLDNRQFVGKTVRRVSNSKLRIYPDMGLKFYFLSWKSVWKPIKVQKLVLWRFRPRVLYQDSIRLHHH